MHTSTHPTLDVNTNAYIFAIAKANGMELFSTRATVHVDAEGDFHTPKHANGLEKRGQAFDTDSVTLATFLRQDRICECAGDIQFDRMRFEKWLYHVKELNAVAELTDEEILDETRPELKALYPEDPNRCAAYKGLQSYYYTQLKRVYPRIND